MQIFFNIFFSFLKKTVSHDVLNFNHITISKLGLMLNEAYN